MYACAGSDIQCSRSTAHAQIVFHSPACQYGSAQKVISATFYTRASLYCRSASSPSWYDDMVNVAAYNKTSTEKGNMHNTRALVRCAWSLSFCALLRSPCQLVPLAALTNLRSYITFKTSGRPSFAFLLSIPNSRNVVLAHPPTVSGILIFRLISRAYP